MERITYESQVAKAEQLTRQFFEEMEGQIWEKPQSFSSLVLRDVARHVLTDAEFLVYDRTGGSLYETRENTPDEVIQEVLNNITKETLVDYIAHAIIEAADACLVE